ncbi:MAG: LemA family protein [Nitrospirae bacterium]|nr:LemA family protein [Nitrospirota bacterium]
MSKGLKITLIVVGVILVIGIMMAKWIIGGYNNAIAMDENVKGSWAQVENQLKRRYDLIPNLVETVKGYAAHEKELFEHIADARTKYFSAGSVKEKINASNQLEGMLSRLLLLNEQYPQLKANENFMKLQDSLEGTENRIAVERMRYNESVQLLNTYIRTFFGRFFAGLAGVTNAEYYELPEGESAVPKVTF